MVTHERKAVRLALPLVVLGDARDVGQREAPASGGPGRARRLGRARDGGTGWALVRRSAGGDGDLLEWDRPRSPHETGERARAPNHLFFVFPYF